jgi:cytochrome c oxidase subunit 2
VASVFTDRALAHLPLRDALNIEVTATSGGGKARYHDADPSREFTTANELHIPVGRPVVFTLRSNDVIHSLWVPNLQGKKDLIPGRTATLHVRADQAGTYRGQCAEFCGFQHASWPSGRGRAARRVRGLGRTSASRPPSRRPMRTPRAAALFLGKAA